jgi:sodium/hydrogen exchanger-like protein 6/7
VPVQHEVRHSVETKPTFTLTLAFPTAGIVAILFCGMAQSHYTTPNLSGEARAMVHHITEILNFMSENFIFAYLGISLFTFTHHNWRPGFIALSIVCCWCGPRKLKSFPHFNKSEPFTCSLLLLLMGMRWLRECFKSD